MNKSNVYYLGVILFHIHHLFHSLSIILKGDCRTLERAEYEIKYEYNSNNNVNSQFVESSIITNQLSYIGNIARINSEVSLKYITMLIMKN